MATTGKDTSSNQVNIVTYDLVARKATYLQDKHFQVVIAVMLYFLSSSPCLETLQHYTDTVISLLSDFRCTEIVKYCSETCLNETLNKTKTCITQTLKSRCRKSLLIYLYKPNTYLF